LKAFHLAAEGRLEPFILVVEGSIPDGGNKAEGYLTGRRISDTEATDPSYWARHLCNPVRFADGLRELAAGQSPILLEVGPGDVLSTFARQSGHPDAEILSSLPHPQSSEPDTDHALGALGRLWVAGVPVDWVAFHEHERLRRVPLPSYPFERKQYCVKPQPDAGVAAAKSQTSLPRADPNDWFYVPSWKETPLPSAYTSDAWTGRENWLVFGNSGNASAAVVDALSDARRIALVTSGAEYVRLAPGVYTIAPGRRDHYIRLARDLVSDGYDPDVIVHLWNATSGAEPPKQVEDASFFSLLFLAQAFSEADDPKQRHILVVSDEVHAATGDENTVPEKALCLGLVKVIPKELPYLQTRAVDLPTGAGAEQYRAYARLLFEPALEASGRVTYEKVVRRVFGPALPLRPSHQDTAERSRGLSWREEPGSVPPSDGNRRCVTPRTP
jgi:acyl transferase domain-containing protein